MFLLNSKSSPKKLESHEKTLFKLVSEHNFDLFRSIFENKKVDVNVRDQYGNTLLICAVVSKKNKELVQFLLSKDIEINAIDKRGRNALFTTCYWGKKDHLTLLLTDRRIDIEQVNNSLGFNINPLAACVLKNRLECFKALLYHGADPDSCERIIAKEYKIFQDSYTSDFKNILDFYKRWHCGKKQLILALRHSQRRSTRNLMDPMSWKRRVSARPSNINLQKMNRNVFKTILTQFL